MTDPYDALMDHLAALAVEAVQHLIQAVQALWLRQLSAPAAQGNAWTCERLYATTTLPAWAGPQALQALHELWRNQLWHTASPAQAVWHWQPAWLPYLADIHDSTQRIVNAASVVHGPRPSPLAALPDEILRGAALFDTGLYFACHEYFETLWGRTDDTASALYQGLIQVAVAIRHLESHNVRGALLLLRAGMGRLQRYPAMYKGLQVATWLYQLATLLEQLETLTEPLAYQFDPQRIPSLLTRP